MLPSYLRTYPYLAHDPTQPPTIHAVWSRGCSALPG